jgi:hypothetical protein
MGSDRDGSRCRHQTTLRRFGAMGCDRDGVACSSDQRSKCLATTGSEGEREQKTPSRCAESALGTLSHPELSVLPQPNEEASPTLNLGHASAFRCHRGPGSNEGAVRARRGGNYSELEFDPPRASRCSRFIRSSSFATVSCRNSSASVASEVVNGPLGGRCPTARKRLRKLRNGLIGKSVPWRPVRLADPRSTRASTSRLDELEPLLTEARVTEDNEVEQRLFEQALALFAGEPLAGTDYAWCEGELRRLRAAHVEFARAGRPHPPPKRRAPPTA